MLTNYLSGIYFTFIRVMQIAMVAVLICTSIKFLLKRKIEFNLLDIIYKFVWFTIVFKKLREKIIYVVLIGFAFSCTIEFLQSFIGRFVQLEDIIMNTIGTFIGFIYLLELIDIYYKVTSSSN
ncbi:MAG: VanZ family protein [Romboutsia sp.]